MAIKFRNSARGKDEGVKLTDDRADVRLVVSQPRSRLVEKIGGKLMWRWGKAVCCLRLRAQSERSTLLPVIGELTAGGQNSADEYLQRAQVAAGQRLSLRPVWNTKVRRYVFEQSRKVLVGGL